MEFEDKLLNFQEASSFATSLTGRIITSSNISYLIQYGLISKKSDNTGTVISKRELESYYRNKVLSKERKWKGELGQDINWKLSFDNISEKERTKHVHRLHPYKGKFIPQLVEYFLDSKIDEFKKQVYFKPGSYVLDPFCGSGTTLVQANELGINSIGIDISSFNALISNVKVDSHDLLELSKAIDDITNSLNDFVRGKEYLAFDTALTSELNSFNNRFFSAPEYRYSVKRGIINEKDYSFEKEKEALILFKDLVKKYQVNIYQDENSDNFLDGWYTRPVREEIDHVFSKIKLLDNKNIKRVLTVILSRTMRSCRATSHQDLATLIEPIYTTYYCHKHFKICKPLFSILTWWKRYSADTLKRLMDFSKVKTEAQQHCFAGDSRIIDLKEKLSAWNRPFSSHIELEGFDGIFSSPPYVGLIDYHEQHAYAYDLFKFVRHDSAEIGPLSKGQTKDAQASYIIDVSKVLLNCKRYLKRDYDIFLVANDKYNLYPKIANNCNMKIVEEFKRPVLNRTEKNKAPYSESIFHMKEI